MALITKLSRAITSASARQSSRNFHSSSPTSFLVRSLEDVRSDGKVTHLDRDGAVESRRYLVRGDGLGFSMQQEVFAKGTTVRLDFKNHVYAMLITSGRGKVRLLDEEGRSLPKNTFEVGEGSMIAMNASETVEISADQEAIRAVTVMNPPLAGDEQRQENGVFPVVDQDGIQHLDYDVKLVRRVFEVPESLKAGSSRMKDHPLF